MTVQPGAVHANELHRLLTVQVTGSPSMAISMLKSTAISRSAAENRTNNPR